MLARESLEKIDREIAKYPEGRKQSAVMEALAVAQDEKGFLSDEMIEFVAGLLGMAPISVREVVSFYAMYKHEAASSGKTRLTLCRSLPCRLSGADEIAETLKEKLGIDFGETTPDGRMTLVEGECMGACGDAPVALIDDKRMCCRLTREGVDALLREIG
ncbi:MAG: NAD(P)H-dependent oxidoreductase subunit E [Candidatus Accumulibacter sp.]|jgi:NADH-quinone oxidoreductase subunit E|nr:NAD(P)H-dependent oxidoreductase subunit E [Accumulibacter sp.]